MAIIIVSIKIKYPVEYHVHVAQQWMDLVNVCMSPSSVVECRLEKFGILGPCQY
jgi:hypothetical protein